MTKTIHKEKLGDLFEKLSHHEIYGPVADGNKMFYRRIESVPITDFGNSDKPPKEVFFPQTETMFDFVPDGNKLVDYREPEISDKSILLFGVRPCDAKAMIYLDTLFGWDYIDPYYSERREKATIISLGCNEPQKNCFCTSMGGGPASGEGADMLWTDLGDRYLVESSGEKGNSILSAGGDIFIDAPTADIETAREKHEKAEAAMGRTLAIEGLPEALEATFDSPYWEGFSKRCMGCGTCTLLCPTCHCFDINDIITMGKGWRERTWDSCQYPYYTLHASGHNPRPSKKHRQRNRVYHKLLYTVRNFDMTTCVGCGRCINKCPVNIDIIEVAEGAKEVAANV